MHDQQDQIAIIGLGCRFPGATGPEAFWRLLRDGVDAVGEIPADRFSIESVYDPRPGVPGKIYTRWGGFLDQVDQFDAYFFGISPREAVCLDPQHRLLLEVAWEALEDAGQVPDQLRGEPVGVFVGMCTNDYGNFISDRADIDIYLAAGNARSVMSGRLSYALGIEGPSIVLDTACSTSLVAVHLACQSLRQGESSLALAGGANLVLLPEPSIGFCQAQMLARDGRCKAFDAAADGFVRSDGVGVVVLKPLAAALADRDPIYAVIRGSAVNNDGRSGGLLMTPSRRGQEAVLRQAYRSSNVSPEDVDYIEAHGTGTSVGDPIEALALGTVLASNRPADRPCRIGSVKTNIGHTEGAAGIAGLIKVALALKHREIPPSLHFREPNAEIPWNDLPLVVQRELAPWNSYPRRALAGVSSFGISGTNAHVVVEQAPETSTAHVDATRTPHNTHLLALSAHSSDALRALATSYRQLAASRSSDDFSLEDLCYTASARRTHHDHRLALVIRSREELSEQLDAFLSEEARRGVMSGRRIPSIKRKVAFVFPGQGSQWLGMARQLLEEEPAFREALERCAEAFDRYVDWSLIDEIVADESHARLDELDLVQPVLCAIQIALATLWRSWGIEPDVVVGHSMGEVAAAYTAGILSLDEAARVICRRSQIVRRRACGTGGMAVVDLSAEAVTSLLAPYGDRLVVAACNGPTTTVISGETGALMELGSTVVNQDTFFQLVKVDYPSHSPLMELLRDELVHGLGEIRPCRSTITMVSTNGSASILDGRECDVSYWVGNLRQPVFFLQAIEQLVRDGYDTFLELSGHPTLAQSISQCLGKSCGHGIVVPSMRRGEADRAVMLESFGALYAAGYPVDWTRLYPSGRVVPLPSYPWQRERFWVDSEAAMSGSWSAASSRRRGAESGHPLLGDSFESAAHPGTYFWEVRLGTRALRYLSDHSVGGAVVFPASAYAEMALAAAREAFGDGPHTLRSLSFKKALFLADDQPKRLQLVLSRERSGEVSAQFFSVPPNRDRAPADATLHATGSIRLAQAQEHLSTPEHESPAAIRERCPDVISAQDFYRATEERGLEYGPSFRGVEQLWRRDGEAIGRIRLTEAVQNGGSAYHVHPALLDACFQVLAAALPRQDANATEGATFLPVALDKLQVHERLTAPLWSCACLRPATEASGLTLQGDIFLLDEKGRVLGQALGLTVQRLEHGSRRTQQAMVDDCFYELQWQPKACSQRAEGVEQRSGEGSGTWLIFSDRAGTGEALSSLLEAQGDTCVMVTPGETYAKRNATRFQINATSPDDFRQLFQDAFNVPPCRGVVHLWSLDDPAPPADITLSSIRAMRELACVSVLHLVQALVLADQKITGQLWLVTRGAQPAGDTHDHVAVGQSPLWGLGRVISIEHPELHCRKVDLSARPAPAEAHALFDELWVSDGEDQIALRGERRYVPRLVRWSPDTHVKKLRVSPREQAFRLEVPTLGILDDFVLRATTRRAPGLGEVEIQVRAVGLNFRDVLIAMGLVPPVFEGSLDFGFECAGTIVRVGDGVKEFKVGDDVLAGAPACFGSFATTGTSLVVPKPAHLSFAEAATIPIALLTAYHALHGLGKLQAGERVLIHAAAGGVGQAAVRLAQRVGAEIFATAGTAEKREFLKSQGVQHVMDSRSLDFAEEVKRLTDGQGVDVVLNSLAGDFIAASLSTLGAGGRFLEIGKVDILQNSRLGLRAFENNISFFAIDLAQLLLKRPAFCMTLLRDAMQSFEGGSFKPLPHCVFPISEAQAAFRHLAQAKHIGKVVVSLEQEQVSVVPPEGEPMTFRSDGTYLISGGLGGLGLVLAQWMVRQGARHLVLTSRSGASPAAAEALAAMEEAGAKVIVARADVSDPQQVRWVLDDISESMPQLRGVVHAAAVLDDGILLQQNAERFRTVMAPKVEGAWNLHQLTLGSPLDFFVLFSSGASVLGSPGQANYVAANAFLDALAHHRRALGLPALAINWGAWAEVGLAARPDRASHLKEQGILPFTPAQGMQMMDRLLQHDSPQVAALSMDWARLLNIYSPPLLSELAAEIAQRSGPAKGPRSTAGLTRAQLLAADPDKRQPLIEAFLTQQIARVLRCAPSKVDVHVPLTKLGIDSLMAVELKNRVEMDLEMTLPVTALLQGPSLAQLSTRLAAQLAAPSSTAAAPGSIPAHQAPAENLIAVDALSDEAVDSLLRELVTEAGDTGERAQEIRE